MTVKVNKTKLIDAIKAKRAAVVEREKISIESSKAKFAQYKETTLATLNAAMKELKAAKTNEDLDEELFTYNDLNLPMRRPSSHRDSSELQRYDQAIKKLEMVDDLLITLNDKSDSEFLRLI